MKPLQDAYARLERDLEAVFAAQAETETLLADPEVYADSAKATELLKTFHSLQKQSEELLEKLEQAEAALAPYETQRVALEE
jgi:ATP-binding cassette subfamily F protein 3